MRGVAFQRSSCVFGKAWASSSVFTTTPSCVVEVESMTSPHLDGHHPPCACLQKGKLPTHLSTCPPRPKANGTEYNQYLTKDCSRIARNRRGLDDYYSKDAAVTRFVWVIKGRLIPLWPWTELRYYRILSFFSQVDPLLRMKRKQTIGGKDETILSATGIRSSRSQRPESTDVISFLCQKALLLS